VNRKANFLLNESIRIDSHNESNRIDSNRELECSSLYIWCTYQYFNSSGLMQMLAKPSSNLLERTGGDHQGGHAQPGWRSFMMTCLSWILGYMRLEIWCKIGLFGDCCLCTALRTHSGACWYWIGGLMLLKQLLISAGVAVWLGSRVVSVLDSGAEGPGFKSQLQRCRVTVLGKLFTPIVPLFTKQRNW